MHFLRSSSVCVLPRYFFRCARYLTVLLHTVSLKKHYIDISYKLDIPPSPNLLYFVHLKLTDDTARLKDLFKIFWVGDFCTALFVFFLILTARTSPLSFWTPAISLWTPLHPTQAQKISILECIWKYQTTLLISFFFALLYMWRYRFYSSFSSVRFLNYFKRSLLCSQKTCICNVIFFCFQDPLNRVQKNSICEIYIFCNNVKAFPVTD